MALRRVFTLGSALARLGAASALAWLFAASAHGEAIYRCAAGEGATLLQNVPCPIDSEAFVQGDPRELKASAAPGTATAATLAAGGRREREGRALHPPAPAVESSLASEPVLGMSVSEVRALLGDPGEIAQEEVVQGRLTTWIYGGSRVLQFDESGHLTGK